MKKTDQEQLQQIHAQIRFQEQERFFFDHLKKAGYWPHAGQAPVLKTLRRDIVKFLFLQCSRNFGKSTTVGIDAAWFAGMFPRQKVYIIAPFRVLAEEIYIKSHFMHDIIPKEWLLDGSAGFSKSELRFYFKNESYIKIDGADNDATVRGYKPTRLACDEFQDWKPEVWQGMEPNLLAHDATVILVGTPPDRPNVYTEQADFTKMRMREGNQRYLWLRRTIHDNPRIPPDRIKELEQGFLERGEEAIWKREYLAEFIPGGASSVFPQFNEAHHVRPIDWIAAQCKGVNDVRL